jgi:ubiquinone/menaquinone biosynthesis C-methylase UbiE
LQLRIICNNGEWMRKGSVAAERVIVLTLFAGLARVARVEGGFLAAPAPPRGKPHAPCHCDGRPGRTFASGPRATAVEPRPPARAAVALEADCGGAGKRAMDYDRTELPTNYDRARGLSDAGMRRLLERLTAHVPPPEIEEIIDLGCGTGRFSAALANTFSARVTGIDPSEKMLAEARRKAAGNVAFRPGSGEALEAADGTVDLVFLSMVFHHLPDPAGTAREALRVLRPGGFVVVRNSSREHAASFAHTKFFPRFAMLAEEHLPSVATMRATFIDAGFAQTAHETVASPPANWSEFADKIALRADSLIVRLSDAEFASGMAALRAYAADADPAPAVMEGVELLVFRKPGP